MGNMALAFELELGLLVKNQQGFKKVVGLCVQRSLGQIALVRGKGLQGGFEPEVEGTQIGQGLAAIEMIGTPEFLDLALIPLGLEARLLGDDSHFIEGFVEESDIGWIDDGAL